MQHDAKCESPTHPTALFCGQFLLFFWYLGLLLMFLRVYFKGIGHDLWLWEVSGLDLASWGGWDLLIFHSLTLFAYLNSLEPSLTLSACVNSLEPLGSMFLLNLFLCLTFSIPGCSWLMLVDTSGRLLLLAQLYWQEFTCGLLAVWITWDIATVYCYCLLSPIVTCFFLLSVFFFVFYVLLAASVALL